MESSVLLEERRNLKTDNVMKSKWSMWMRGFILQLFNVDRGN